MDFELPFFTNLLILLVTAKVFGEIFERFKQPAMIGEILAGIILGPSLFGLIHATQDIKVISELGIFLLVILAGLEINIDDILKSLKGKSLIISIMAFFIPLLSGFAVGYFFGLQMMTTMFVGLCIAITALPVSIRILMDLGKLNTDTGQKIISVAIFDDVAALTILGVLLNIKDTNMSISAIAIVSLISLLKLIAFIALLAFSYYMIKKLSSKGNFLENAINQFLLLVKGKETLFAVFFAFILLFSSVTEALGFHFIIGAFFASMLLNESILGKDNLKNIEKTTSSLAMGFLAPIFFASIGLEFNISSIHNIELLLAIVLVSYISKIIGGYLGSSLAGLSHKVSLVMGFGLNARGIMELVIANIAFKAGLIDNEIFSILVIMGVLTTITTPIMLKWGFSKMK
ncbi:cation:proton antiporter [Polaribacter glomeratus]|uniref:Sodium:proton antiporter n=1 Tax=Polaribacter glomeratus TaxID=102 RepID=A0A2S7WW72_9FLAO|nr:cation:proton antiporter [Polaribacter glomeratus]PQJ81818.1 sodium:proton antiporter [Polaribacter glomeratus]TXD66258.1 cation:proton antiporter [Polaribacter glomeratus]